MSEKEQINESINKEKTTTESNDECVAKLEKSLLSDNSDEYFDANIQCLAEVNIDKINPKKFITQKSNKEKEG